MIKRITINGKEMKVVVLDNQDPEQLRSSLLEVMHAAMLSQSSLECGFPTGANLCDCLTLARALEKGDEIMNKPDVSAEVRVIDLGLPSGTLWSDRNVGAASPEDVGLYFSWGNTDGHAFGTDYDFDEKNYNRTPGAELTGEIDLNHDAARVNMGKPWRMPTSEQFHELCDNCTHEFVSLNGYRGVRFISKVNENTLFFPCSGKGNGSMWFDRGWYGYYWAVSIDQESYGRKLRFDMSEVEPQYRDYRFLGFAVRAVQNIRKGGEA